MNCLWTIHRPPAVLQEDILHHVFGHVADLSTLARAAAVCRGWAWPARTALYRDIEYHPLSSCSKEALLARTMRTQTQLLRFVRRLSLVTTWTYSPIPELCEWIEHIPENRLQEFCWTWERGHLLPSLLTFPAVRAVRRVKLRGQLYTMAAIQSILELPALEYLSLELRGDEQGTLAVVPPRLRRLSVIAHEGHSSSLDQLLAVVGSQIDTLHITCKLGEDSNRDAALVSCIHAHCPDLSRLKVDAIGPMTVATEFADALVKGYPSLEYLRCGQGTFSPHILRLVPPNLRVLKLAFAPALDVPLLAFLTDPGHRLKVLRVLELSGTDVLIYDRILAACNTLGVDFRLYHSPS
ncbi:hypothetical protein BN946_scf185007.g19 [Trametes cinnabarina]|uniref:Uncharacterized protein n=1 Tax=Pycnoporus cinnabarinus TaxID=5643 RepID=A0A060SF09_PYCCI|nr:hypothetical protein BN946_scf185007.g19 [Trametes cinnabarina]